MSDWITTIKVLSFKENRQFLYIGLKKIGVFIYLFIYLFFN